MLLLDEPTNHIDPVAEEALYADMARLFAGKLVFVVTHRMSMVSLASRVIVMEGGRIVADGPHGDLYRTSTLYRELYDTQSRRYFEPETPSDPSS